MASEHLVLVVDAYGLPVIQLMVHSNAKGLVEFGSRASTIIRFSQQGQRYIKRTIVARNIDKNLQVNWLRSVDLLSTSPGDRRSNLVITRFPCFVYSPATPNA